jgi:hypothetical protein
MLEFIKHSDDAYVATHGDLLIEIIDTGCGVEVNVDGIVVNDAPHESVSDAMEAATLYVASV